MRNGRGKKGREKGKGGMELGGGPGGEEAREGKDRESKKGEARERERGRRGKRGRGRKGKANV